MKQPQEVKKSKTIHKIGAILPLTGDAAIAGKNTQKGINLAVSLFNNESENDSIVVIYEDTKADPKTGISAVYKLINDDNINYIIDNSISSVTLAVAPVINKNNVVLLATGASSPKITIAGKNIFRIWNSDNEEANTIANFISKNNIIKQLLILYENNEYGVGLKNAFKSQIKSNIKEVDISDKLIIEKNINKYQALYIIAHSKKTIQTIKKVIEKGYKGIILGTSVMLDPNVKKILSEIQNTTFYPTPSLPDSTNTNYKNFVKYYLNKYKSDPVPLSDVGYDAVKLYMQAISNNPKESEYKSIIDYFNSGFIYFGASGKIQFDKNGDVHKPIEILKIN